jgi:hypothetical protein
VRSASWSRGRGSRCGLRVVAPAIPEFALLLRRCRPRRSRDLAFALYALVSARRGGGLWTRSGARHSGDRYRGIVACPQACWPVLTAMSSCCCCAGSAASGSAMFTVRPRRCCSAWSARRAVAGLRAVPVGVLTAPASGPLHGGFLTDSHFGLAVLSVQRLADRRRGIGAVFLRSARSVPVSRRPRSPPRREPCCARSHVVSTSLLAEAWSTGLPGRVTVTSRSAGRSRYPVSLVPLSVTEGLHESPVWTGVASCARR